MIQSENYWYIKNRIIIDNTDDKLKFKIETKRMPRIIKDDNVIVLEDSKFVLYGYVNEAPIIEESEKPDYKKYIYTIIKQKVMETEYDLNDFAYSLTKIYKHFDRPYYHFIRNYGVLKEIDYNTIISEDFYVSRTAVGRLINAMHIKHRYAFIEYATSHSPEKILNEKRNYFEVFEMLQKYVENAIIIQSKLLLDSKTMLNELEISQDISFVDPIDSDSPSYNINLQCDNIIRSNSSLPDNVDLNYIRNGLEEYRDDDRAKSKYFIDKCLPIKF